MRIHIGNSRTMRTLCDKPVARRWWIALSSLRKLLRMGNAAPRNANREANCKTCLREYKS